MERARLAIGAEEDLRRCRSRFALGMMAALYPGLAIEFSDAS